MNSVFIAALAIYLIIFIAIAVIDYKKSSDFEEYVAAGKRQGLFAVTMTLLATMVGASATLGIADTVFTIGFPGIWWLVFGSIGLLLQSLLLSEKIRGTDATTLPELAGKVAGSGAETITALVIAVSWIGVIAGQFAAINGLLSFALGKESRTAFLVVSLLVIIYTLLGGQLSVVRTDRLQLIIMLAGLFFCFAWLYIFKGENNSEIFSNIELLNGRYTSFDLVNQFFVIGGVYFLGPDIISRNLISKDGKTAKKAAAISAGVLILVSLAVVFIGMWVRAAVTPSELGESRALLYAAKKLPGPISLLLVFGLLSAILSSLDTCIINASSIFTKDILKKDSTFCVRMCVIIFGGLSLFMAGSGKGDIISLLSGAYSVYTPGIIFPLFIAIMANGKRNINKKLWIAAVALGGLFGLAGTYFSAPLGRVGIPSEVLSHLPLIGMFVSLAVSLAALLSGPKSDANK